VGDRYNPDRDVTAKFLDTVNGWIGQAGEVLVVVRYLRAGGAKDFTLCRSREEFAALVAHVPLGTDIEVFRDPQLPLRGVVDETFVAAAEAAVTPGQEYVILTEAKKAGTPISSFSAFDIDREFLKEILRDLAGQRAAFGRCPDFLAADHEGLISASKGGIDGPR
jgi:hypothetical protein